MMNGHGKLTDLLTKKPICIKQLRRYGRSKNIDVDCLVAIAAAKCYGVTVFHMACAIGTVNIVELLLHEGWDVDILSDKHKCTPLWAAIELANVPVAKLLIQKGADTKFTNPQNISIMGPALTNNKDESACIRIVEVLLDAGFGINDYIDLNNRDQAIHFTAAHGQTKLLKFLLQNGADINAQDSNGITALHLSTTYNHVKAMKILLNYGAHLYIETNDEETALQLAIAANNPKALKTLVRAGFNINRESVNCNSLPLYTAVEKLNIDMIKLLIELGADPNKCPSINENFSIMHLLASPRAVGEWDNETKTTEKRKEIAEYLIEQGAILNLPNKPSPLVTAIQNECYSLATLFIELGARINIINSDDICSIMSLFHLVTYRNDNSINRLLEFGADYNFTDKDNLTPYHFAILNQCDMKYVKAFVKHGTPYNQNPSVVSNIVTKYPEAMRFFACEKQFFLGISKGDIVVVMDAVKKGAVINGCSDELRFPVHYLAFHGFSELLDFLLCEGVPPNKLNDRGESALFVAAQNGHYDCCCTLLKHGACYAYPWRKTITTSHSNKAAREQVLCNRVSNLLHSVGKLFAMVRNGHNLVITKLEKMLESNLNEYLIYANAIDRLGDSLLAAAIRNKHNYVAQEIMRLQTRIPL